jgi:hypothetical protein
MIMFLKIQQVKIRKSLDFTEILPSEQLSGDKNPF